MIKVNDIIRYTNKSDYTITEIVSRLTNKSVFVKIIQKEGTVREGSEHRRSLLSIRGWKIN